MLCTLGSVLGQGSPHVTAMLIASENKKSMLLMDSARSQSSLFESKAPAFESGFGLILLNPSDAEGCRRRGLALCS